MINNQKYYHIYFSYKINNYSKIKNININITLFILYIN